jgi:hypothetical protein
MTSWSWTLLNVIAWSLGLKAVYDLRRGWTAPLRACSLPSRGSQPHGP